MLDTNPKNYIVDLLRDAGIINVLGFKKRYLKTNNIVYIIAHLILSLDELLIYNRVRFI